MYWNRKRTMPMVLALGMVLPIASPLLAQGVVQLPNTDAAMNAAKAKAQATLPDFFKRLAAPQPGDSSFAVKIRYETTPNNSEHIWAVRVERVGDRVSATINNRPERIANLKEGQRVTVPITQLSDWMYVNSTVIYGGYTIRAALPAMPKADADTLRARLAPE